MRARMMMAAMILATAATAPAAPLCRDSKGLFTPCIGERPPVVAHHRPRDAETVSSAARSVERAPAKPPLVARARLCRDNKGLFTPCAR